MGDETMCDQGWKLPAVVGNTRRGRLVGGLARFWNRNIRRNRDLCDETECRNRGSRSDDENDHGDREGIWVMGGEDGEGETSNRTSGCLVGTMRKAGSEITLLPPLVNDNDKPISAKRAVAEIGIAFLGRPVTCANRTRAGTFRPLLTYPHQTSKSKSIEFTIIDEDQLRNLVTQAKESQNFSTVTTYYTCAFSSFRDLNDAFKIPWSPSLQQSKSGLNLPLVKAAYECLSEMPSEVQKATLKSVINCLLTHQRNVDAISTRPIIPDDMRAYMILLQHSLFRRPSTYVVFAHLLRLVATLCETDQEIFAEWLAEMEPDRFSFIIQTIQTFISVRMFPPRPQDLPPVTKCTWWIPCAVRTLAILNVTNNAENLIPFTEFHNQSLDHWDLMTEFHAWEAPILNPSFSFCQYPFILSINAKKSIMEGTAAEQMIASARDSLIGNMGNGRRLTPNFDILFLNVSVRRSHLVRDSLRELLAKQENLRKKLRIQFAGEPGLDMGGLTKEWFQLLIQKIFNPDFGMFIYHTKSEVFWFRNSGTEQDRLREYHLIGVLMGLAVYNGVILDVHFPHCCYKKLLSPPVMPSLMDCAGSGGSRLGICTVGLDDLEGIVPDTTKGLRELLTYEGDVEEDFGLTFQVSVDDFGELYTEELCENGKNIPVTNKNRSEYVQAYVDWFINRSISHQFKAFYLGFHSVCSSNALLILRPEEVELLVCGSHDFNMADLKKVTTYDGYKSDDKTVRYFWDLVLKLPQRHQKRLLIFSTGTDRIPAGGMKEMTFKMSKMTTHNGRSKDMLPVSHTCFNHLILPDYQDRRVLRQKLAIALAHGEGFGLE